MKLIKLGNVVETGSNHDGTTEASLQYVALASTVQILKNTELARSPYHQQSSFEFWNF